MENKSFLKKILGIQKTTPENIYEKVVIVAKRARQIVEHRREEFANALDHMGILESNNEQLISTEGWQEVLSKTYEEKVSPVIEAQQELAEGILSTSYLDEQKILSDVEPDHPNHERDQRSSLETKKSS